MKIDPFPGTLTKQPLRHNSMGYVLTDEQRAWLCKWFPEEENSRLMKASGMSHSTLHRFAREFGLTKSPKGWKRIKKRQAAHIKRVCEKNGYYDSLRGKQPSEACRKATAQMWQDIAHEPSQVSQVDGAQEPRAQRDHPQRDSQGTLRHGAQDAVEVHRHVSLHPSADLPPI